MADGTKILSDATGGKLSRADIGNIWSEVVANRDAWKNCPAPHHIVDLVKPAALTKFRCRICGATQSTGYILGYIAGFVARGGDGAAVWSEWTADNG